MPSIRTFTGEFPCLHPTLLPENAAQEAIDCDFSSGILTGILERKQNPVPLGSGNPKSIYIYIDSAGNSKMFSWWRDVDAVRGPVANDAYNRFYWSDGAAVYVSNGTLGNGGDPSLLGNYARAGVPVPTTAPTCSTLSSTAFIMSGITGLYYYLCCEDSTGAISSEQYRAISSSAGDRHSVANTIALSGFACSVTASASGITYIGPAYIAGVTIDTTTFNYACVGYGLAGGAPYYFFCPHAAAVSVPGTMHQAVLNGAPLDVYNIGSSWFCTNSSATVPPINGTTGAVEDNSPGINLAIKVYAGTTDGRVVTGILRSSGVNTLPPEFDGYTASVVLSATTAIITWSRSSPLQARAYVITFVNPFGEEGAPSLPLEMDANDGEELWFTYTAPVTTYGLPAKARLYRASGTSGQYLYVTEAAYAVGLCDNVKSENLGEPLSTTGYLPPETGLKGLIALPNGVLAAFKGNEVHLSEPYLPYAWKTANIITVGMPVVGLCAAEGGFYITTKGCPYFVSGLTPDAMSETKINVSQAGVSKGSIVNIGQYVVYASNDGLVTARGTDVSLDFSFKFFTRRQWRLRYGTQLAHLRLNAHDGHLLAWFDNGSPGFLIRYDEAQASLTKLTEPVYAANVDPTEDALYLAVGLWTYEFKGGTNTRPFTWQSKDFVLPKPANLGALQLIGSGPVAVTIYADGTLVHQESVTIPETGSLIRPPAGFLASRWSVKVVGSANASINQLHLVGTPSELKNV